MLAPAENPWGLDLWILRSDETEHHLGGNKFQKLTGYLDKARRENQTRLITMAGPHSNHLRAFAALARRKGFAGAAIIRGDELVDASRHSEEIRFALECGVRLIFVTRQTYRALRETSTEAERSGLVPDLDFAQAVFVREGGLGPEGLTGVIDWAAAAKGFDEIYIPCATGTTCAGFLAATNPPTQVFGVAVLRNFVAVHAAIKLLVPAAQRRFTLLEEYAVGKFGKLFEADEEVREFCERQGIVADGVYVGRTLAALAGQEKKRKVTGRVLFVYTYNE